jgi:hypothetical protein
VWGGFVTAAFLSAASLALRTQMRGGQKNSERDEHDRNRTKTSHATSFRALLPSTPARIVA